MCGINGYIDLKRKVEEDDRESIVHAMNLAIIHRGPDSEGIYSKDYLTMGMRRLSILDLQGGSQPVYNKEKTLAIVFNGEIYNFRELRSELISKGHEFVTDTDTEVIVHGFEENGSSFFERLDGMFAFSLYDTKEQAVYIVRDRMGEKPLYYYADKDKILWASEIRSIANSGLIHKKIDKSALNLYMILTFIPAPMSIYEGVNKLRPGHFLKIKKGKIEDRAYWELKNVKNSNIEYEDAKKCLRQLLFESVEKRMISDVPLGAFLSGGIDSATVVAAMSHISKRPVETFTIGFKEREFDERQRAKAVADMYGTSHHEYELSHVDVIEAVEQIVDTLDEPFADTSAIPTYFVSKYAKEYMTVALTGDGGDELFLGYSKYLIDYYLDKYEKLPKALQGLFEGGLSLLPDTNNISRKVRKVTGCRNLSLYERRKALMSKAFREENVADILSAEYYAINPMEMVRTAYNTPYGDDWKRTQYMDISIILEGDMLTKVDRMSMQHSLETRVPLLSKDIVEFSYSLPTEYKLSGKNLKRIFKDTFSDMLPKNFANLPKAGFDIPLDIWFRNTLKDWIESVLSEERIKKQGVFNYDSIRRILDEHYAKKVNHKDRIWSMIVFTKWADKWL